MPGNTTSSDKSAADACEFEETEESITRHDGLAMLDHLIGVYYNHALETYKENFKPGDLMRLIQLRYKLSPTNAEQEKFWAMLAKIRRDSLKKLSIKDDSKKIGELRK